MAVLRSDQKMAVESWSPVGRPCQRKRWCQAPVSRLRVPLRPQRIFVPGLKLLLKRHKERQIRRTRGAESHRLAPLQVYFLQLLSGRRWWWLITYNTERANNKITQEHGTDLISAELAEEAPAHAHPDFTPSILVTARQGGTEQPEYKRYFKVV